MTVPDNGSFIQGLMFLSPTRQIENNLAHCPSQQLPNLPYMETCCTFFASGSLPLPPRLDSNPRTIFSAFPRRLCATRHIPGPAV